MGPAEAMRLPAPPPQPRGPPFSKRRNAICAPSGDQAGNTSAAGWVVSRLASGWSAIFTQMSQFSSSSPPEAKAICTPSGEKLPMLAQRSDETCTTVGGGREGPRGRHSVTPATTRATRPAASTIARRREPRRVFAAPAGDEACESDSSFSSWSSIFTSATFWKRRPGSLRRQRRMVRSRSRGRSGTSSLGGFGCSLRSAAWISALELPVNGRRPVNIS
jgi:hypothetical protein